MTTVHRVVLMIIDDDNLGRNGVIEVLENTRYPNHCMAPKVMQLESRGVEWDDDHPLNKHATQMAAFSDMFDPTLT